MITYREYCKTIKEDWGKTSPIPKEVYDFPDPLKGINWIDLGLPSGTLWADENLHNPNDENGLWTYDEIMNSEYEIYVPTLKQIEELWDSCDWEWGEYRHEYVVSGGNGHMIRLPGMGQLIDVHLGGGDANVGYYLTSTPKEAKYYVNTFYFNGGSNTLIPGSGIHCGIKVAVRLVKKSNQKYNI